MNTFYKKNINNYLNNYLNKKGNEEVNEEVNEELNEELNEDVNEELNEDANEEEYNKQYKFEQRNISAYQQLSSILNALKSNKISVNDAMNKIQLKDSKPVKPYCKVTSSGALALYGISKQPIVLYSEQWNKLLRICKTNYIENYMSYNETRLKYKKHNFTNSNI